MASGSSKVWLPLWWWPLSFPVSLIYRIMYGQPCIKMLTICEAIMQQFLLVTSSLVKSIAEWPHKWQKSSFPANHFFIYSIPAILCIEHTKPSKTIIDVSFRQCEWKRYFLTLYCNVTTIDLWRHANNRCCYCDVIFFARAIWRKVDLH